MKSLYRVILALVLVIGLALTLHGTAMAEEDTTWQEDFTYTTSAYKLILSKYNGTAENLTIPATARIGGAEYTVQLAPDCHEFFRYKRTLKTVAFASGVDTGLVTDMRSMFSDCSNLTGISGLSDVHNVVDMQLYKFFGYCDSLSLIRTPLNLSAELQTDLPAEFTRQDDPGTAYTTLPTGQTASFTIVRGPIPFGNPTFTLPAGTTTVEANAFEGAYMSIVSIPADCQSIGDYAFKDCVALVQIRIPKDCTLGGGVFDGYVSVMVYGIADSPADLYCRNHDNCTFIAE